MKNKYLKILVTGGAGFIGSHVVDKLIENGLQVTVLDNLINGNVKNIIRYKNHELFNFVKSDIRCTKKIEKIVNDHDAIIHLAALTSILDSIENPAKTNDINLIGTLNLLDLSLKCNVKKFIFSSSASVYGKNISPLKEDMKIYPKSPYAVTKACIEYYLKIYFELYDLKTVSLRYFNVYGTRANRNQGVISIFINDILENRIPHIYGDGTQTRDFINVKDVANANLLSLNNEKSAGEIINIGSGNPISINKIKNIILEKIKIKNVKFKYLDSRMGEIKHGFADITKAKNILNFEPQINFDEGITECINWYQNKK